MWGDNDAGRYAHFQARVRGPVAAWRVGTLPLLQAHTAEGVSKQARWVEEAGGGERTFRSLHMPSTESPTVANDDCGSM